MGQQEIYDLLKMYKKQWLNAREMAGLLNVSLNNIASNLRRLKQADVIMCKTAVRAIKTNGESRQVYVYRYKK